MEVTRNLTVWEVSQRTGVPVERILEFNAHSGNPLDIGHLRIGSQIFVPMDPEDVKFKPKTAEEVHALRVKAVEERKARESVTVPAPRSSDDPAAPQDDPRAILRRNIANDRAHIAEQEKVAASKVLDPSTWFDNPDEKARNLARDTFKQAVDRLESVLNDPKSTEGQIQSAIDDKVTALNLYTRARGRAEQTNEKVDFLSPVKEALQAGAESVRTAAQQVSDKLANTGLPEALAISMVTPVRVAAEVADTALHVPIGVATGIQGAAGVVAHPFDSFKGIVNLIDRTGQTMVEGRAFEFMAEVAFGKYDSPSEALDAFRQVIDRDALLKARVDLGNDVMHGLFAESIKLAKEGRFGAAAAVLLGESADVVIGGMGALRGAKALTRAEKAADIANDTRRVAETLEDGVKAADRARDLGAGTRVADEVKTIQRTPTGTESSKIAPKTQTDFGRIPPEHHWRYERYLAGPSAKKLGPDEWLAKAEVIWRNNTSGNTFEQAVRQRLGVQVGRGSKPVSIEGYVPDLPVGARFGVTEVKDLVDLSNSSQLAAFHRHALDKGLPFNLVIGPRTRTISAPLLDNVRRTNGIVRLFDPVTGKFSVVDIGKSGAWRR